MWMSTNSPMSQHSAQGSLSLQTVAAGAGAGSGSGNCKAFRGSTERGSVSSADGEASWLPEGTPRARFAADLRTAFAAEGWRIRTADQAEPGVNRFLDRAASFLTLAGLTALLVGGIGVATGVRGWLDARARSIATLRCLGAPSSVIFLTYLIQVLALAGLGIAIGLIGGYGLTWLAAQALSGSLPVPRA